MSLDSIKDKAVREFSSKNRNAAFDPAIIMVIADIIVQLVSAFQSCKKDNVEAVNIARNPTWLQRRMLRRKVRRELGARGWREHGHDIVESLLEAGKDVTPDEMQEAMDELDV